MTMPDILLTLFGMAVAIFLCRALPLFLPQRWLQLGWLQSLNQTLPLCIMLILLFASLSVPTALSADFSALLFESAALVVVLLSYMWLRNTLLSVILGVVSVNLLYLLG
ncbi:AzlD domain-containing protein [Pasteurella testudinis]|uniref:AzlD domain-containing protein n=1 Tax=Pasteurella testudinis TaxID=761 RepID=UPI00405A2796